jgi:uncharacterized protein (TIGR02996 family)
VPEVTDREAFVAKIIDHPAADLPRLVFADWLDENGEEDSGMLAAVWLATSWAAAVHGSEENREKARIDPPVIVVAIRSRTNRARTGKV